MGQTGNVAFHGIIVRNSPTGGAVTTLISSDDNGSPEAPTIGSLGGFDWSSAQSWSITAGQLTFVKSHV
jgi:hypothetical protein